jgi:hypothetical protein
MYLVIRFSPRCCKTQKLRDILEPVPDMADTLLVWGSTFRVPTGSGAADDPKQRAIEAEISRNICKTPISVITLQGEVPQRAAGQTSAGSSSNSTEAHIASMAEQLQRRRDKRPQQSSVGGLAGTNSTPSEFTVGAGGANRPDSGAQSSQRNLPLRPNSGIRTRKPSFAATESSNAGVEGIAMSSEQSTHGIGDVNSNSTPSEPRDLAWFGGVHTDCNTILYKAPLQGWNTLLPSSFAGSMPVVTPARRKR